MTDFNRWPAEREYRSPPEEVQLILEKHLGWLSGGAGKLANLQGARLAKCDLRGVNLKGSLLTGADLSYANLSRADCSVHLWLVGLFEADYESNLERVDLRGADMRHINLSQGKPPAEYTLWRRSILLVAASSVAAARGACWPCGR